MVIQRCAWHTTYRGYPLYYGLARDGRLAVTCRNGICSDCAARVRVEWYMVRHGTRPPLRASTLVRLGLATLALAATLLAAHVVDPAATTPLAPRGFLPNVTAVTPIPSDATVATLLPPPPTHRPPTVAPIHPNTLASRTHIELTTSRRTLSPTFAARPPDQPQQRP